MTTATEIDVKMTSRMPLPFAPRSMEVSLRARDEHQRWERGQGRQQALAPASFTLGPSSLDSEAAAAQTAKASATSPSKDRRDDFLVQFAHSKPMYHFQL